MENSGVIDILITAVVAIFIFWRLFQVLGRKDGTEHNLTHNVKPFWERTAEAADAAAGKGETIEGKKAPLKPTTHAYKEPVITDQKLKDKIAQIQAKDSSFTPGFFLHGAKAAFEMVLEAYAAGDKETLKDLLDEVLYKEFAKDIDDRKSKKHTRQVTLITIENAEILEIIAQKQVAEITVRFTSDQINVVRDEEGKVVEGDETMADDIEDVWTFRRALSSSNPNWKLVDIQD